MENEKQATSFQQQIGEQKEVTMKLINQTKCVSTTSK